MNALDGASADASHYQEIQSSKQSRLLIQHAQRSVFSVLLAASCIVYAVVIHTTLPIAFGWLALVVLCLVARSAYAKSVMPKEYHNRAREIMRHLGWFAALNGLAVGCSAPLFFNYLPDASRAIVSMLLVGISVGGIVTSTAYPPVFLAYIVPALMPLAVSWVLILGAEHLLTGVLILLLIYLSSNSSINNFNLLNESFQIRFEHQALIVKLEQKQQELLKAKKQAEEAGQAKEQAEEAGQAKARLLATASHDLRQPLHALSLYSAILSEKPEPAALTEVSSHIDLAVRALNALLNALLEVSQLDAGVYQVEEYAFDARKKLARIVLELSPLAQKKGLMLYLDAKPAEAYSDPVIFERIARNLIDNAIKYTDQGAVVIRMLPNSEVLRIEVEDTGKGIHRNEQQRIFEEFYQLDNPSRDRERGLGLGLSIVKRLAQLVGSDIELASTPGKGSCFAWQIPLRAQASAAIVLAEHEPQGTSVMSRAFNILIIEDEIAIQHGMSMLLKIWGMHPFACATQAEAEQTLAQHSIDLIIADLRLQRGISGLAVLKYLCSRQKKVPVLLISGETDPGQLRDVAASGYPLLTKPILPETLHQTLIDLLEK